MSSQRDEERWVADMVSRALGLRVVQHDDNSRDAMYDLDLLVGKGRRAAMEVAAAADADSIELWKLVNPVGERWTEPSLTLGWIVSALPNSRAKRLRVELPHLLAELEAAGVTEYRLADWDTGVSDPWQERLHDLRVAHVRGGPTDYPGAIYPTIEQAAERTGGFVDPESREVPGWLGSFLQSPGLADVRRKLQGSGADERHAFILLPGFTTAPFAVVDMLWRAEGLPSAAPPLPPEVTHAWLASTWNAGAGARWSPDRGWEWFSR